LSDEGSCPRKVSTETFVCALRKGDIVKAFYCTKDSAMNTTIARPFVKPGLCFLIARRPDLVARVYIPPRGAPPVGR
jgi:hypothetical protein